MLLQRVYFNNNNINSRLGPVIFISKEIAYYTFHKDLYEWFITIGWTNYLGNCPFKGAIQLSRYYYNISNHETFNITYKKNEIVNFYPRTYHTLIIQTQKGHTDKELTIITQLFLLGHFCI